MELGSPNDGGPPSWCGGRYSTPSCGGLKTQEECDASVVAVADVRVARLHGGPVRHHGGPFEQVQPL